MDGNVVIPGDVLFDVSENDELRNTILGPGLRRESDKVIVTKCGIVRHRKPNVYWIDAHHKKYIPARGEAVIGIVISKGSESVRVDLGSSEPATLSLFSFEGVSRRNLPIVQVGDVVYAKVLVANKDMEPEIICIDSHGKKAGLGVLPNRGFVFTVSLDVVRKILSPQCVLLKKLGEKIPFEIAVGMNGKIWICARTTFNTMLVYNCITLVEHMNKEEIENLCQTVADRFTAV
ncbi:exosome complex component RRP40-like [Centruroides sculpturatus]|uniref:exosome complex component RRP40-like n=1 Tax=Centruroides sculpturatus TaxID=218467 RepID=UPI000C6ED5BB|nr:exosome complex component RRP40-like [Centruroides sculpturatus]